MTEINGCRPKGFVSIVETVSVFVVVVGGLLSFFCARVVLRLEGVYTDTGFFPLFSLPFLKIVFLC